MTDPTLSTRIRAVQDELNTINHELTGILADASHIGLHPFRVAGIKHAIDDNHAAWDELNAVARSLELTHANRKL